ncbi:MAG: hypothetical protein GC180_08805 [Bacteroidetes bacterium]|nr:hypothetical protein [Bacteroidota bacterium]
MKPRILKRRTRLLAGLVLSLFIVASCKKVPVAKAGDKVEIEKELDAFVSSLASDFPADESALTQKIDAYIGNHSVKYYGSTVTVLDSNGKAIYSPYVYRKTRKDRVSTNCLMDASYKIDEQSWLRSPIDQNQSIWTDPYYDAGGGEIWMQTRSVPVRVGGKIIAVATTDVRVKKP